MTVINSLSDFAKQPRFLPPVDFDDILAACHVVDDTDSRGMPWEDCDGLEHELADGSDVNSRNCDRFVSGRRGGSKIVKVQENIFDSIYAYARQNGASKQVAFERAADNVASTAAWIADKYNNGMQWYGVVCEGRDIPGIRGDDFADADIVSQSLWGIDDEKYAQTEVRQEIAEQVAAELESLGYRIKNKPARKLSRYSLVNCQNRR